MTMCLRLTTRNPYILVRLIAASMFVYEFIQMKKYWLTCLVRYHRKMFLLKCFYSPVTVSEHSLPLLF